MKPKDLMGPLQLRASFILATGGEKREQITTLKEHPPCFDSPKHYEQWLRLASASPPPTRKDFPVEPNYCRDCSVEGQRKFINEGRCLFPMVRFQGITDPDGDEEVVGYTPKRFLPQTVQGSHGHNVAPLGAGLYRTSWIVSANGSEQTKVVDLAAALRFCERWGVDFSEAEDRG